MIFAIHIRTPSARRPHAVRTPSAPRPHAFRTQSQAFGVCFGTPGIILPGLACMRIETPHEVRHLEGGRAPTRGWTAAPVHVLQGLTNSLFGSGPEERFDPRCLTELTWSEGVPFWTALSAAGRHFGDEWPGGDLAPDRASVAGARITFTGSHNSKIYFLVCCLAVTTQENDIRLA